MNHYPHHLGDYAKDTQGLTQGQHGAYRLLIDSSYASEQGIPDDEVYGISKAGSPAERKNTDKVLTKFYTLKDGRWIHKRIEKEIAAFRERSRIAAEKANKRWRKDAQPMPQHDDSMDSASPPAMLASSHKPVTSKNNPEKHIGGVGDITALAERLAALSAICLVSRVDANATRAQLYVRQWAMDGVTDQQLTDAIAIAREHKPHPAVIPIKYLAAILPDVKAGNAPTTLSREEVIARTIARVNAKENGNASH